jgi:hypothetical protein
MNRSTGRSTGPGTLADLGAAVKERDVALVTTLLAGVERLDGSLRTVAEKLLEWAVFYDHIAIVRAALEKGAPANTAKGSAPRLASARSIAMARLLIDHGADVRATWIPTRNGGHVGKNKLRYHNYSATRCERVGDAGEVAFRMVTGRDDFARLIGAAPASSRSLKWDPKDEAWLAARLPRTWKATRL